MSATPPCSAPAYGGCSNTTTAPSSSSVLCQRHSTESGHDGGVGGSNADDHTAITHRAWLSEAHYQISKALPMAIAGTIRSLISIIELRALGHIGSAPLAGRSLSLLIVNLTGYPFMYGLGGALESLCSQAYTGARNHKIGIYVQHSIWIFLVANLLVIALWLNPQLAFSMLSKTDPEVLRCARVYLAFECIYFPFIIVQTCLKRFLLAQGLMRPTVWFELSGLVAMWVSLRVFVDSKMNLGFIGVPLASTMAYLAVLVANILYIYYAPCRSEWGSFTMKGFRRNAHLIISLGIPCAVSGISSYGFSDLATIAVTALGAEGLAIQGVLNSLKSSLSRTGSYLGMVISTRVGNLLGANKPIRAHLSAKISALMTICATALLATIMLACKKQVAMFITKDKALVDGLLPIIPLLVVVVALDIVSNVLTGVLRGQGRQGIAAVIRVIALYGMAVPLSFLLCFTFGLGLYGLWIGLATGFVLISCAEAYLVFTSDWKKEAENSIERVNDSKHPALRPPVDSPLEENSPLLRQSTSV